MKLIKKLLIGLLLLFIISGTILTYMGYRQYKEVIEETPLLEKLEAIKQKDTYVTYDEISPMLLQATIAIEDHRFYGHDGIDFIATIRAFLDNLTSKEIVGGGSTITQQLAKNLYFGYHPSLIRKISELFVVHDLESQFSKEEILTFYVNIINYGDNHMGIQAASMGYFDCLPKDLSLQQSSLLAGLPQSPANYQLSNHYDRAIQRQKQVLEAMVKEEMITESQMQSCLE